MFCFNKDIKKQDTGDGTVRQNYPPGVNMNMLHSFISDKTLVASHTHPEEQMGFIVKGILKVTIGDETVEMTAGDAYFVPPDIPHSFIAVGDVVTIDVFSPIRKFWSLE